MQNKLFATMITALLVLLMAGTAMCTTVSIGDGNGTVTIPIVVEDVTNLGSCNVLLEFNESIANVTGVEEGMMDNTIINDENAGTGTIRIVAYQVGGGTLNGSVTVANITFAPVDPCAILSSDLNITVTTLKEATPAGNAFESVIVDNGVYTSRFNGDVSGGGIVDSHDVLCIAMFAAEYPDWPITCIDVADVDGSGATDIADAAYLAKHIAGLGEYSELK